ncbi:MAG: ribosome maturation factor RimP [Clostridia bacterium]|nr:ribosome maturation factor RimP [Clostridia bacterium]
MAKAELTAIVEPKCLKLAEKLGFELVDVCLDKEGAGKFLRIYIDKPDGITLDDCEAFHREIQPQVENCDYDFLEVSSPGIDRPLKKERDFLRNLGEQVEVHLFKPMDGVKTLEGTLAGYEDDTILLETGGNVIRLPRKEAALVKLVIDMSGIEDVEL